MKPDEIAFFQKVHLGNVGTTPRMIAEDMGMNANRAAYLCDKWTGRGWYEYGVNVLCGWLTDAGHEKAAALVMEAV